MSRYSRRRRRARKPRQPRGLSRARGNPKKDASYWEDRVGKLAALADPESGAPDTEREVARGELRKAQAAWEKAKKAGKRKGKESAASQEMASEGFSLPACSAKPDLYILPISPVLLGRYLDSTILWMAEQPWARQQVEAAMSSFPAHGTARPFALDGPRDPLIQEIRHLDSPGGPLQLNAWNPPVVGYAQKLLLLVKHAPKMSDGSPSFGLYDELFGEPGSAASIRSAFGVRGSGGPRMTPVGVGQGAHSLLDLYLQYIRSGQAGGYPKLWPTFYLGDKTYRGTPVAVVVAGPRGTREGMQLAPPDYGRKAEQDLFPVAEAVLWRGARDVCLLVPPVVIKGRGRGMQDVARGSAWQLRFAGYTEWPEGLRRSASLVEDFGFFAEAVRQKYRSSSEAQRRADSMEASPPRFFSTKPFRTAEGFYGEFPDVQGWPAEFIEGVNKWSLYGYSNEEILEALWDSQVPLEAYRGLAEDADLELAHSIYRKQHDYFRRGIQPRETGKEKAEEAAPDTRIRHFSEIPCAEQVVTLFGQNLQTGEYIPLQAVSSEGPTKVFLRGMADAHGRAFFDDPTRFLPPVQVAVCLFDMRALGGVPKKLLKRLSRETSQLDKAGRWRAGISSTRVGGVDMNAEGSLFLSWRPTAFLGDRDNIPDYLKRLLRLEVSWDPASRRPHLRWLKGQPAQPWRSPALPYLLSCVLARVKVGGSGGEEEEALPAEHWIGQKRRGKPPRFAEKMVSYKDDEKAYTQAFSNAFGFSRVPEAVRGGRAAHREGREMGGKPARGGQRAEAGRVPLSQGFSTRGFWNLVRQTLAHSTARKMDLGESPMAPLHQAFAKYWPTLLGLMNEERAEMGEDLLSPDTPLPENNAALEREALGALKMLLTLDPSAALYGKKLMHPLSSPPGDEGFSQLYGEEVQEEILAVENPRRRKGRRKRKPRKSRRSPQSRRSCQSRSSRRNPVDEGSDEWKTIEAWLRRGGGPLVAGEEEPQLSPAASDEEFIEAVMTLFPPRGSETKLSPLGGKKDPGTFTTLMRKDVLSGFHRPGVDQSLEDQVQEAMRRAEARGVAPEEAVLEYLSDHAGLTAEEALDITKTRKKARRRGRAPSPSGTICRLYHVVKLREYRPPPEVLTSKTAWILIGPGEGGLPTRVMTFRSGAHIDCDMLVGRDQSFSVVLGRALQSMLLWLAESRLSKKTGHPVTPRLDRIKGVFLGQVGGSYRTLWEPQDRLDIEEMLKKAYSGPKKPFSENTLEAYFAAARAMPLKRIKGVPSVGKVEEVEERKTTRRRKTKPETKPPKMPVVLEDMGELLAQYEDDSEEDEG